MISQDLAAGLGPTQNSDRFGLKLTSEFQKGTTMSFLI